LLLLELYGPILWRGNATGDGDLEVAYRAITPGSALVVERSANSLASQGAMSSAAAR
jgi:hypothetical protein